MAEAAPGRLEQTGGARSSRWDLIAGASHDLRTPISSIGLMIDAIADDLVDDSTTRRYYGQIRKQLRLMTALTEDLITISRISSQDLPESRQILDLNELIHNALDTMSPVAAERGVQLSAEVSPSLEPISADADRLLRVLLNLIANAIRHTPPRETVLVAAMGRGDVVRLEVRDSGAGVSLDQREEVFKPFARGEGRETQPGHAGLGLAICRAIIERHGGRIWIGPSPRGARFCVEIPTSPVPPGPLPGWPRRLMPAAAKPLTRGAPSIATGMLDVVSPNARRRGPAELERHSGQSSADESCGALAGLTPRPHTD